MTRDPGEGAPAASPDASIRSTTILEDLAEYCLRAGEFTSAVEYYTQILALADPAARSSGMLAATCRKMAVCLLAAGDPRSALEVLNRAGVFSAEGEDPTGAALGQALRAQALAAVGDGAAAERAAADALASLAGLFPAVEISGAHRVLGELLLGRGELTAGREHLESAIAFARDAGAAGAVRDAEYALGALERRACRLDEASRRFASALADESIPSRRARLHFGLAEVRLWQGRFSEACSLAAEGCGEAGDGSESAQGRLLLLLARRAAGGASPEADAGLLADAARAGGLAAEALMSSLLLLETLRERARRGDEAALRSLPSPEDPLAEAVSGAALALETCRGDGSPPALAALAQRLAALRDAGARDPLGSILLLAAGSLAAREPEWSDAAALEALRLAEDSGRVRDAVAAHRVRARVALERNDPSAALRCVEAACRLARAEGDEHCAALEAVRAAVDEALSRQGASRLGDLSEFSALIRGLRLLEDPNQALRRLAQAALTWTGGDEALLLSQEGDDPPVLLHCAGDQEADGGRLEPAALAVLRAVTESALSSFTSTDPSGDRRLREEGSLPAGIGPIIAAPLLAEGRVAGILFVTRRPGGGAFPHEALAFLITLSAFASALVAERQRETMRLENIRLRRRLGLEGGFDAIVTQNARMLQTIETLKRAASESVTVLLQGETGTGKELVARAIHQHGLGRRGGPFVTISCAELTEPLLESELFGHVRGSFTGASEDKMGLFQLANGGTIFLDEIDKTSRGFQETLLRVVDKREVKPVGSTDSRVIDVRIICASNADLRRAVLEGRFLKDLYYRLRVVAINLPPLRERGEDIPLLAEHFLRLASRRLGKSVRGFSQETTRRLLAHDWPGNVRDLENEIERLVALTPDGEEIQPEALSADVGGAFQGVASSGMPERTLAEILEELEKGLVLQALQSCRGNRTKAAKRLGLSRRGLLNKIERFGLVETGRADPSPDDEADPG